MSKLEVVELSTGERVFFKGKYNHKMDKTYWNAWEEGSTKELDSKGRPVTIPTLQAQENALEQLLLLMIDHIEHTDSNGATNSNVVTMDWLDDLETDDYGILGKKAVEIRKRVRDEKGKKNSAASEGLSAEPNAGEGESAA